ncbi:MAG TPA: cell wall hydrolase [Mobilitalea sp.]|nr:cell wall hydrolase [Mobilitalea sp.]
MKNMKKLLSSILISAMILLSFNGVAFASETDATKPVQDNLTYDTIDEDTLSEDTLSEDTSSEDTNSEDTDSEDTTEEVTTLEDTSIDDATDTDEPSTGDYEIYIDEQGEVFYLEKEPEEVVVEEATEVELEEEKVAEEADEAEKSEEKPSYSKKDLRLLACLVYTEAGNQSYKGMLAVANVVLNRAKSDVYFHVDTIKEVIYDKKWSVQFAVTVKGSKSGLSMMDRALEKYDTRVFTSSNPEAEKKAMNKAIKAAKAALKGENNIGDYLCFNAINKSTYRIKNKYPGYKILGDHIFYRTK